MACLSEIASHRNTHQDLCSRILRQPIYSLVQYADGAQVNTCSKENLQANVELTYFTSAYIILGLTLNPNKRKHFSSHSPRKHSCHPTKAQPTIDPLKMITSRQFNIDRLPSNIKVTGLMYSAQGGVLVKHFLELNLMVKTKLGGGST